MWKTIKAILLILIILFFATFAVENSTPVPVNWYFLLDNKEFPLYALLYGFLAAGMLVGMVLGGMQRIALWRKNRELKKEVARLSDENITAKMDIKHQVTGKQETGRP